MPNKSKDPCKLNACKIQSCLTKNNYQESACLDVLEEMRQCCLKYHDKSLCCSGIKLDKPYIETSTNNGKSSSSHDISQT
ncbi:cx9C motif-containing protein 4 [Bradysia coprophila]|uniref:cx9C motif-containing protein 4 n=1 Tax=Bradysia coprophila TaxID=38358 RepID=UPI00187DA05C|nr:cx9C motif-containing protein 4 [Bradysia coprophila]